MPKALLLTHPEQCVLDNWRRNERLSRSRRPQPAPRIELAFLREQYAPQAPVLLALVRWSWIRPDECRPATPGELRVFTALGVELHPLSWQAPWHARHLRELTGQLDALGVAPGELLARLERHVGQHEARFIRDYLTLHPHELPRVPATPAGSFASP